LNSEKAAVHDFWNAASCGEELYLPDSTREGFRRHSETRYLLEPEIVDFARFESWRGQRVLEVGVGLGADHQRFAEAGAVLTGIDLTERAIRSTGRRFDLFGLDSKLQVADAEQLPFEDASFDLVYSWGVMTHSPDTPAAIREAFRVLRPGGTAKLMLYHKWSFVGFMLWTRYALLRLRPFTSLVDIYGSHLESPGTKAYSVAEAREMLKQFEHVQISTGLTHGDLLTSQAGQRHRGPLLTLARILWPRWLLRALFPRLGLFMLVTARKAGPATAADNGALVARG
jgi:ubiquinone/menaquinone biosynthesis C-methylase UbiE